MGAATVEETDQEREARLAAEQAEMDGDNGAELEQGGKIADGQTGAKQVDSAPEELLVAGTTQLELLPSLGGKKPTGSTVTLQGLGGIPVMQGQAFEKGQLVRFEGVALIEEVAQKDNVDRKAGVAVGCKQIHKAFTTDVRLFPASSPRLPDDADLAERVTTAVELLSGEKPDVETALEILRA